MICKTRKVGTVTIFTVSGDIAFNTVDEIREMIIKEMANSDAENFLIDLSEVGILDSSGIGLIISTYKSVLSRDGSYALFSPNEIVKQAIDIVGLSRLFKVYESEEVAIRNMDPPPT